MPAPANGKGGFRKTIEGAERRHAAADMRSRGATWKQVADEYYRGSVGNAHRAVTQFWADLPKETAEEIRSVMLTKLANLEAEVRKVMARRHYVVAEGRIVIDHRADCERLEAYGAAERCTCPKLQDDDPIYRGVDRVRQLVETQLKLIPGLAVPARVEQQVDQTVNYVINADPGELEQL